MLKSNKKKENIWERKNTLIFAFLFILIGYVALDIVANGYTFSVSLLRTVNKLITTTLMIISNVWGIVLIVIMGIYYIFGKENIKNIVTTVTKVKFGDIELTREVDKGIIDQFDKELPDVGNGKEETGLEGEEYFPVLKLEQEELGFLLWRIDRQLLQFIVNAHKYTYSMNEIIPQFESITLGGVEVNEELFGGFMVLRGIFYSTEVHYKGKYFNHKDHEGSYPDRKELYVIVDIPARILGMIKFTMGMSEDDFEDDAD